MKKAFLKVSQPNFLGAEMNTKTWHKFTKRKRTIFGGRMCENQSENVKQQIYDKEENDLKIKYNCLILKVLT